MRIGIDCKTMLHPTGGEYAGVGHYTYYLVKHLLKIDKENTYVLFFHDDTIDSAEFKQENVKCVFIPFSKYKKFLPLMYSHIIYPYYLKLYRLTVYHNPANVIPLFFPGKSVITLHDLALYLHPEWFPARQFFSTRILIPSSIRRANRIIVPSENTKKDIIEIFKYKNRDTIRVIYEGVENYQGFEVDTEKIRDEIKKIKSPYFLTISTIEPRKNIDRLIKAFKIFVEQNPKTAYRLLIAGRKGWKYKKVFNTLYRSGLKDHARYLGYVNLDEKVYLMKNAFSFIFPSLYEGFGLPIIEAMSAGAPIITSNVGSIPELVIDNAIFINPHDIESITNGMELMIENDELRGQFIERQKGIIQNLTWENTARKTLEVYEEFK